MVKYQRAKVRPPLNPRNPSEQNRSTGQGQEPSPGLFVDRRCIYTGWEYHERPRDREGHFVDQHKKTQMNIRLTEQQHAAIRARANALMMDMTAYLMHLARKDMLHAEICLDIPESGQEEGWK